MEKHKRKLFESLQGNGKRTLLEPKELISYKRIDRVLWFYNELLIKTLH